MRLLPIAALIAAGPIQSAIAQTQERAPAEAAAPVEVEEVLVVGARRPRPIADVVGTVDVIDRRQLLENLAVSLPDVVRYTPGVSVSSSDTRFSNNEFTIRGLTGDRVVTMIDGITLADQFGIGAFANAGHDYLVPDTVSRVEILRGPSSTLFGSDALGGVVAFLTRDPQDFLGSADRAWGGSGTYGGADDSTTLNGFGAARSGSWEGFVHGSWNSGGEPAHSAGGPSDDLDRRRRSILAKAVYRTRSGGRLKAQLDGFDENVDSDLNAVLGYGRRFRNTTVLRGDDSRRRVSGSVHYELGETPRWVDGGTLRAYVQQTEVDQKTYEERGLADPPVQINRRFQYDVDGGGLVADLESSFAVGAVDHRLGWGLRVDRSEFRERRDGLQVDLATGETTNVLLGEVMPVRDFPNSKVLESGAYLHDEIRLGSVTLIPGIRFEYYEMDANSDAVFAGDNPWIPVENASESEWVPKLGVLWRVREGWTAFAQYARGFRAPPFEDVNIGFDIPLFNYRGIPNPDLKSESSDALELGVRYAGGRVWGSVSVFGADYDDFIETRALVGADPDTGALLFQSRNIDKARVYGAEVSFGVALDALLPGLRWESVGNWTVGENRKNDEPLNTVDPPEFVTTLSVNRGEHLRVAAIGTYVFRQDRIDDSQFELFEPGSVALLDLTASYRFSRRVDAYLGVFNVFDETYWRWSQVRNRPMDDPLIDTLSEPGRYASLTVRLAM